MSFLSFFVFHLKFFDLFLVVLSILDYFVVIMSFVIVFFKLCIILYIYCLFGPFSFFDLIFFPPFSFSSSFVGRYVWCLMTPQRPTPGSVSCIQAWRVGAAAVRTGPKPLQPL